MRHLTGAVLAGLVLLSAPPAHAWAGHHMRVYGVPVAGHHMGVYGVPYYAQPMTAAGPVNPFLFQQFGQGLLLQGLHFLVGGLQQGTSQDQRQGNQPPAPQPKVSQDVVDTLQRIDASLDSIIQNTNDLTTLVRDPKLAQKFPKLKEAIAKQAKVSAPSGEGKTVTPP